MEIKELSVGNLIYVPSFSAGFTISEIGCNHITTIGDDRDIAQKIPFENLLGMPLTEEWLGLFGFETDLICYWLPSYQSVQLGHFADGGFILLYDGSLRKQMGEIKYVHELQNLFRILMGKELEFKYDIT